MQNEILHLTKDLIRFKTVNGNDEEFKDCFSYINTYFKDELKSKTMFVREYKEKNVISNVFSNVDGLEFDIILNGHIDVVDAQPEYFKPVEKKGKLMGRGTADMKASVAVLMAVFKKAINSGIKKSIALMLTSDEESGGESGVGYLVDKIGYKCKLAIIPDAGHDFELVIKEKGSVWIKITADGEGGHGSMPWKLDNPILRLLRFYQDLEKAFPPLEKNKKLLYHDRVSLNLGKISGGIETGTNSVPKHAEMEIDVRYSEKQDKERISNEVRKIIKEDEEIKYEIIPMAEMLETDPTNNYLVKYKSIAHEVLKKEVKTIKSAGASDARFFSAKNMPVIATAR